MSNIIDAIIIDTSAIEKYQFDFLGWTSQTLPAFYDLLVEKNITLLNHFVLDNEIKRHISRSAIIERMEGLQQTLQRNKDFFKLIDVSVDESIEKIKKLDVENIILQEYMKCYNYSQMLSFTDPQNIFETYFSVQPPFSKSGNKKNEFPDAFIIDAVKKFIAQKPVINILVISSDNDWEKAFRSVERVSYCSSIDEAIRTIQNADKIIPIINDNMDDILSSIAYESECECFDIPEYRTVDYIEISSIVVESIDYIIPLKVTDKSVLFKCTAQLKANGTTRILDEERSYYDREDDKYYFISYLDICFKNAVAEVECEIKITFSSDESDYTADIENTKITTKYNIDLDLQDAELTSKECSDDDLALDMLREDMGL